MKSFAEAPTIEAFLEASRYVGALLASDDVRRAWTEPSAVELMTVGDICGHVFLIVRRVGKHLENAQKATVQLPAGEPAGWTWLRVRTAEDLDLPEQRQVRLDGAHVASWGWEDVHSAYDARVVLVEGLLQRGLPPGTGVAGQSIPFSGYLATRVVELIVHADDLACSVGLASTPPALALTTALDALVDASCSVHGGLTMLRALSRPERASGGISVF
jgi:hypothetical protein